MPPPKGSPKGSGVPRSGGFRPRRAVLLVPESRDRERWVKVCGAFVLERRYELVAVVARPIDAFYEIVHGRADVVVVLRESDLFPLVESVAGAGPADDPMTRRPGSIRTGRVVPRGDRR